MTARPGPRTAWWTVLAGLAGVACAACCAAPLLVAGGLLAGGGMVGALLKWLPAAVALAAVPAVAYLLPIRRNHVRACAGGTICTCTTDAGESSAKRSTLAP